MVFYLLIYLLMSRRLIMICPAVHVSSAETRRHIGGTHDAVACFGVCLLRLSFKTSRAEGGRDVLIARQEQRRVGGGPPPAEGRGMGRVLATLTGALLLIGARPARRACAACTGGISHRER